MIERIIAIYGKEYKVVGVVLVNELDLKLIDKKVVVYASRELADIIVQSLRSVDRCLITYTSLQEKLVVDLMHSLKSGVTHVATAIPYVSSNKNKSSRDKRLFESIGLEEYVRVVENVGTENVRHLRKR